MEKELMYEVLEELKDKCAACICDLREYNMGMSDLEKFRYIRNNKDKLPDDETESPFWSYRMYNRYCTGLYCMINAYDDINEKVLYDYSLAKSDIRNSNKEQINNYKFVTNQIIWREVQQERALLLYGKIPDDVLNEILSFI